MDKLVEAVSKIIDKELHYRNQVIIAIDGRSASGKTKLAKALQQKYDCNVIHMDHFFLSEDKRTEERLAIPGENIDHERLKAEVLEPLKLGMEISYRPYNCNVNMLMDPVVVYPKKINIIEGTYACNKNLWDYYDVRIFLTTSKERQFYRIYEREGAKRSVLYTEKWIPMEETYVEAYDLQEKCDYCFET